MRIRLAMRTVILFAVMGLALSISAKGSRTTFGVSSAMRLSALRIAHAGAVRISSNTLSIECSSQLDNDLNKHAPSEKPSELKELQSVGCDSIFNLILSYHTNHMYRECFDLSKIMIETCPQHKHAPMLFGFMTQSRLKLASPTRSELFDWLKSVLYLNTVDPEYFCQCVLAIEDELPVPPDNSPGAGSRSMNIPLALQQWLIENTNCDSPSLWQTYRNTRRVQFEQWSADPTAYDLDTTLPSMHDLGLDSLLELHFHFSIVKPEVDRFESHVHSLSVRDNPFQNSIQLDLDLGKEEYVEVGVTDVLGHKMPGQPLSSVYHQGITHRSFNTEALTVGTYYLRVTLGSGESRTIKLVKQ